MSGIDRRALSAVAVQFFVNGAMTASFASRLPELRDQIDVAVSAFGAMLTFIGAFGLLGSVAAGRVIHRLGTRRVMIIGAFVMSLTLPVIGSATTPATWIVGMVAFAILDVLVDISMNLQGSWISARRHVPVMNRLHGLWSLGTVAGGLVAAQVAGARVSLAVHLSTVALVSAGLLVVVARRLLRTDEQGHADAPTQPSTAPTGRPSVFVFGLLALGGAFAIMVEQVGSDWAAFRLADDFGASPGFSSLGYVAFTVGMAISRFGGDQAQARIGRSKLHRLAVSAAIVGLAVASLVSLQGLVPVGYWLAGVGVATFMPRLYDDAARAPGRRGAGLGVMTGGMRVGSLIAPALVGAIAGTDLSVGDAVALVTLPCALGFAAVTILGQPRSDPPRSDR